MIQIKTLNINRIKKRRWYHQRFDGSPMFIGFIALAEPKREKRKPRGTEADVRVCFFDYGNCDWYLDMADVKRGVNVLLKQAKKDPKLSDKLLSAWKKDEQAVEEYFYKKLPKVNFQKLAIDDLLHLWEHYVELAVNRFTSSAIIDHFALGTDQLIADMLKREISKANKKLKESDYVKIFAIASAPTKQSFFGESEIDLIKIILRKTKRTIKDHQKRYFWINNNYVRDQILTVKDFEHEIKTWKHTGKDLEQELKRIQQTPINNKKAKAELFRKYKLSVLLKTLLKISDDFTWWQDERKKTTYLNIHAGCKILSAIVKRTKYTLDELKHAEPNEIAGVVKHKMPSRKDLQQRMKGSAFIATRNGIEFVTGKKIEELRQLMFGSNKLQELNDFRGLSASTGKATGTVKVLKSSSEISKVKQGDILVAVMTRPDYVVAMKKAAAIVTNEGGITSHAAIVSRELGIPCIIGTKIATEVLKDGDLVEVDANHGWVRKL